MRHRSLVTGDDRGHIGSPSSAYRFAIGERLHFLLGTRSTQRRLQTLNVKRERNTAEAGQDSRPLPNLRVVFVRDAAPMNEIIKTKNLNQIADTELPAQSAQLRALLNCLYFCYSASPGVIPSTKQDGALMCSFIFRTRLRLHLKCKRISLTDSILIYYIWKSIVLDGVGFSYQNVHLYRKQDLFHNILYNKNIWHKWE